MVVIAGTLTITIPSGGRVTVFSRENAFTLEGKNHPETDKILTTPFWEWTGKLVAATAPVLI